MGEKTAIAWATSTWNPWIGCTKVGPGCDHCYAADQDARKRWDGGRTHWGPGVPRYRTSEANWRQPVAWGRKAAATGKPWRVFCGSLMDVFDNEVPWGWRNDLWNLIRATPSLSWLLVTKRIGNAKAMLPRDWCEGYFGHCRIIITVVNQEEADRDIPKLLVLPCKNGISYEPVLGLVDWSLFLHLGRCKSVGPAPERFRCGLPENHEGHEHSALISTDAPWFGLPHGLGWIIVGGESGPKARPFDIAWARSTIAQCKAAETACFVKQLGTRPYDSLAAWKANSKHEHPRPETAGAMTLNDRAGADPAEWPEDLRVRQWP